MALINEGRFRGLDAASSDPPPDQITQVVPDLHDVGSGQDLGGHSTPPIASEAIFQPLQDSALQQSPRQPFPFARRGSIVHTETLTHQLGLLPTVASRRLGLIELENSQVDALFNM